MIEHRQLEYLVAIVEHGGFTNAARALQVTQPSISRAVGRLEREMGVELFHRIGRNAVLSRAGVLTVDRARQVLRELDDLRAMARAVGAGIAGRVDIAATTSAALGPVLDTVDELHKRHPGVTVSIWSVSSAAEAVAMVLRGRCSAGVCGSRDRPARPGLMASRLRDREYLLVAPPGTQIGVDGAVAAEDLRGHRFVVPPPGTAVRDYFDRLAEVGDLSIAAEVGDCSAILPMVLRGIGVSIMSDGWHALAHRSGSAVRRFSPSERVPQWLVYRSVPRGSALQVFIDTINSLNTCVPSDAHSDSHEISLRIGQSHGER
ncbi:LysR family transcriptional regulator [Nocardia sp. NBC_01499]|uniref:LysR family transcriptional regulator n=1 Tax=Nocardia sp. NBC_01499 TaxID=2903597 RepID=UPI00386AD012